MVPAASRRPYFFRAWFLGLILLCGSYPGSPARAEEVPAKTKQGPPASVLGAEWAETLLGGFYLTGQRPLDRLSIPDLDFLEGENGERLLPLLRLLGVFRIESRWQGEDLIFFSPQGPQVRITAFASGAVLGTEPLEGTVLVRTSDLTGNPELFIADSLAARTLAMDISWNEAFFGFEATPRAQLPVFERTRKRRTRAQALTNLGYSLPEPHGPAVPRSRLARVDFLQARLRASLLAARDRDSNFDVAPLGATGASAMGSLIGGNYRLSLRQRGGDFGGGLTLEQASWSLRGPVAEISAGDRVFGLSSLVFPTVSATGIVANGITGLDPLASQQDASNLGTYPRFPSALELTGVAALGSKVELRINGQFVSETIVDIEDGVEPGTGVYLFEGVNLFSGRANDVHLLITHPDGTLKEIRKEMIGSTRLLQTGQFAFVGGTGVKRNSASDRDARSFYGKFAGVRGLYGVSANLTAGATIAWQEEFSSPAFALRNQPLFPITRTPENTLHSGAQVQWRAFDPFLLSLETATVSSPNSEEDGTAWLAEGNYRIGRSNLDGRWFRYSENFFDGTDERLSDRQGVSLDMTFPITNQIRIRASAARVEDNVNRADPETNVQNSRRMELMTSGLVPKTLVTLKGTHLSYRDEPSRFLGGIDVNTSLVPRIGIQALTTIGDDLRSSPSNDLFEGLSIPGVTSFEVARTHLQLSYSAGRAGRLTLSHSQSTGLRRTLLGHTAATGGRSRRLRWRSEIGIDWDVKQLALQNRIDYTPRQGQAAGVGLEVRRTTGRWSISLSILQEAALSFLGGSPKLIVGSRLNPERGGVKGLVFLDTDGDGILDPDEKGLPGFRVITERGFDATSDEKGNYFLSNFGSERIMRVSFDAARIPATFTPTNGTQEAVVRPGLFTTVNLGLATFATISGSVRRPMADGTMGPAAGLRVEVYDESGKRISESITARDGTYYLDGITSGNCTVRIDPKTVPRALAREGLERPIEIVADSEFTEIEDFDFTLQLAP